MTDDREIPQAENVGAWILGALDEDEARAFAAELERSQALRDEVERLQPVGDVLAMGADQMDPPPALRDRLMATVRSEAQLRRAAEGVPHPVAPVPAAPAARRARRSWLGLRPGLAVGLACAAAALVAVTAVLVTSGDEGSPTPGPAPAVAFRITTPGASGVLVSRGEGGGEATFAGLPAPPPGRAYEAWVLPAGATTPVRSTVFRTHGGRVTVHLPHALGPHDTVMVTEEPAGGSDAPTGTPLATARIT